VGIKIYHVDTFTDVPFKGNPAAVCILPGPGDENWMQYVANEQKFSETAFVYPKGNGFFLRWFTPVMEVDLCGHATLACAHILWETNMLGPDEKAQFMTKGGRLTAEQVGGLIELDFPVLTETPSTISGEFAGALGIAEIVPKYVGQYGVKHLIEVESEETVRALKPDFQALCKLPGRGVCVTGLSTSGEYDFVSRYFAPWAGVNEDPVTGTAHCCLGPFWGHRLGKTGLKGYQASERGGIVYMKLLTDRIGIGGYAITTMRGELLV